MTLDKPSSRLVLIDAALEAFGQHGFTSTSTRDIARAADMPMSQITYHFGGKEGLYLACAETIAEHMGTLVGEELTRTEVALAASTDRATARACLGHLLSGMAKAMLAHETLPYTRFVFREQAEPTAAFAILYGGVIGRLLAVLEALLARISGKSGEATRILAIALFGQVLAYRVAQASVLTFTGWNTIDDDQVAAIVEGLMFNVEAVCDRLEKGACA